MSEILIRAFAVNVKKLPGLIFILIFMSAHKALAIPDSNAKGTATAVSASINPGNVTWDLENQLYTTSVKPANFKMTPISPQAGADTASSPHAFILKKVNFKFVGEHIPTPPQVAAIYEKSLNKPIDLNGLTALAAQMETEYRSEGYILIQVIVPPQVIDPQKGAVTFEVIEGQIQNVIFTGDDPRAAKTQLERYAHAIEKENPVTYQTLDHFLTLANNLPGIDVQATLVPNEKVLGAADLVVNVTQQNQSAFLSFNNHGTPYIGPGQALAGGAIYNIFGADSLSISGATSTSKVQELHYVSASYDLVTGPYSTNINSIFSATQTRPGGALTPLDLLGNSDKYTLNLNQPLIVRGTQNLTFNSSIYHLDSDNRLGQTIEIYDDHISAITAGATYQGLFLQSLNTFDAYTTIGLPILGTPSTLSNPSRSNGRTKFIILDFDTSTIHYLTQKISFDLATTGQITGNPLLTEEQIGYGGMAFGQAFTPYIISGDNGFMGSLALRYDVTPVGFFSLIQPEAFFDAGVVGNNAALTGTVAGASASSAGVGLNITLDRTCQINLTLAKPLTLTQVNNITTNSWEGFVNVVAVF